MTIILRSISAAIIVTSLSLPALAQDMKPAPIIPTAKPEEVGLSSERLAQIGKVLNADIERGRIPGAVVAIVRRGKLVYFEAFGYRDKAAGVKMTTDTIFNIASMTKPMAAVAALQLYEQGKLAIDDPLEKYFPKFAGTKVAVMDPAGQTVTGLVPAARKITIQDLMRHTSGLIYGGRGVTAVHKMYPAGSGAAAETMTGAEFLDKLASLPVLHQPGAVWDYGFGLDVLGLVVESLSEQSLGQYMQEHIWKPLGMIRHRLLHRARQGRALRQGVAGRSRHRQAADGGAGADREAAEVRVRRRLRRLRRRATTCASRSCC